MRKLCYAAATCPRNLRGERQRGSLTEDAMEQRLALIAGVTDYGALADADVVVEAVFEEMGVKQQVFEQLDAVCKPGAILASNTSSLDLNAIAAFTKRPEDVVGLHFFSPANVMRLLEVVRGERTSDEVLATAMAIGKQLKKVSVVVGVCDGFVGNRMVFQYGREAEFLLEEGATPQQVDAALRNFGMAMGPFAMRDLSGLDIGQAIRKRQRATLPAHLDFPTVSDKPAPPACSAEDRCRLLPLRTRQPHPAGESRPRAHAAASRERASSGRRWTRSTSSSAASSRWSTRARRFSRKASPSAPATSTSSTSTATASRPSAAGRCTTPTASAWTRCWRE